MGSDQFLIGSHHAFGILDKSSEPGCVGVCIPVPDTLGVVMRETVVNTTDSGPSCGLCKLLFAPQSMALFLLQEANGVDMADGDGGSISRIVRARNR